ncbi:MAG: ATP-binding cassette domain-containing protein [Chloroflexi bacterium]|nr:ATP-binding cassette domain-containing protein [Chloroflexota bacterium]
MDVLAVEDLRKHFPVTTGLLQRVVGWVKAVDGVDFAIGEGETLGLVGESGCGKTTTARMILRLEKMTSGSVLFRGQEITGLSGRGLQEYRRSVQAVFQDPYSSLNPRLRVGTIVGEPVRVNSRLSRSEIKDRVREVLGQVGLNPACADLYPHEFSGGQRQRVAVARALSLSPSVIVLDEPVSALDVSIRAQIMNLLRDLQERLGVAYLLIAHDLAVMRHLSCRVAVMYLGKIVEYSETESLYCTPLHPYTQALLSAALPSHPDIQREEIILRGEVPSPLNPPSGCRFHPRCFRVMPVCSEVEPRLKEESTGQSVACHLY